MNRLNEQNKQTIFLFSFLIADLIIFFTVIQQDSIASLLFYISFFLILLLWIIVQSDLSDICTILVIIISLLSFFCVLINALMYEVAVSFNYLKKCIMFISTILLFDIGNKLKVKERAEVLILYFNLVLSLCMIVIYFKSRDQLYMYNGYQSRYLVFNFGNPNKTGMYLAVLSMYNCISIKRLQGWFKKTVALVATGFTLYFLVLTECRTALIALLIFIICVLFKIRFFMKGKKRCAITSVIVAILPIVFAGMYILLIHNEHISEWLSFLAGEGKSLDSRYNIWELAFSCFRESPIFGAYAQLSNGTGTSQMHNIEVDILSSYGVGVFFLTIVFLAVILYKTIKKCEDNSKNYLYSISLIIAILLGCGEAALFSGAAGYNILISGFIVLAGCKDDRKTDLTRNNMLISEKNMIREH